MTALEGLELGPVPTLVLARTEHVYVRPLVEDVTSITPAADTDDDRVTPPFAAVHVTA